MVKILVGNILESKAQTLVNTVNCVGVMGKGIALAFRRRFPDMYRDYVMRCSRGEVRLGQPYIFKPLIPPWIVNFPTKDHWRALAKSDDIVRGLDVLLENYKAWAIESIAIPPLGAGLGQLEWRIVGPILFNFATKLDIPVELYAPHETPSDELELEFLRTGIVTQQLSLKTPAARWIQASWIALVEILHRLEAQPYHWPVGRTTYQKLAYVASASGLPLDLAFERGSYGPYAPALSRMTSRLLNNDLITEEQVGNLFHIRVGPRFEQALRTYGSELAQWESIIERVVDLFSRTTTRQAEVIATVLYATRELGGSQANRIGEAQVITAVLEWKVNRRPPFELGEVVHTVRNLAALGWLRLEPNAAHFIAYEALV